MSADARYLNYFAAVFSRQGDIGGTNWREIAQDVLARIEAKLRADGFAPDVIAQEMTLARGAAEEAAARIAAPEAAPNAEPVAPVAPRLRLRPIYLLFALLGLVVYLLPLALFVRDGRDIQTRIDTAPGEVAIGLKVGIADFGHDNVTFHVVPTSGELIQPNGMLSQNLEVEIDPGTGPLKHTFSANTTIAPWTVKAEVDSGDILDYPFDRYEVELVIQASAEGKRVKVITALQHVPHGLAATHAIVVDPAGHTTAMISFRRAGTIIFLALLSTLSLVVVASAACTVAWQVAYRGRDIDFSKMVWVAALLFVIPTVRNALPGAVPPGALIDFLVFFWLEILTAVAMTSLVVTWIRRGPI